jgi:hypothetical protein
MLGRAFGAITYQLPNTKNIGEKGNYQIMALS